jgi:hypothetical protein
MKKFLSFSSAASLLILLVACGSGNPNNSFGEGGGSSSGNFSLASLNGSYTFQASGTALNGLNNSQFTESAIFVADGKGNIANGTEDVVPGNPTTAAFTGSYTLANDGTGFMVLSTGEQFAITMVNSSKFYLSEIDSSSNSSGVGEQQTLTSLPDGTFTFRIHTTAILSGSVGQVGAITISNSSAMGTESTLTMGGSANSTTISGSFNTPVSGGRGSGTLNDSNGTLTFQYYVVNANTINIMPVALNAVNIFGTGRAELQNNGPFSASSLSGNYAFGSKGDTNSTGTGGAQTVGRFTAVGGTISEGQQDFVLNGNNTTNNGDTFTGSYTFSNGSFNVNLSSAALGAVQEIWWPVSPTRFFFLVNDPARVEDGTIDAQTSSSFSNSSFTGQSAFFMSGYDSLLFIDRIGTLQWQNGKLNLTLFEIDSGATPNGALTATYSVASNGRGTTTVNSLPSNDTSDFAFYLISNGTGYIIQNDSDTEIGGQIALQSQ